MEVQKSSSELLGSTVWLVKTPLLSFLTLLHNFTFQQIPQGGKVT